MLGPFRQRGSRSRGPWPRRSRRAAHRQARAAGRAGVRRVRSPRRRARARVSRPENGGARNALSASPNTSAPNTLLVTRCSNSRLARGRENRSNQRLRRSNAVTSFCREGAPSSSLFQRAGSQMHRRPTTSCSATSIVTASRTCVAPPVGSGSAGSAISSTKMSAKLRGPNSSMRLRGSSADRHEPVFELVADRRLRYVAHSATWGCGVGSHRSSRSACGRPLSSEANAAPPRMSGSQNRVRR